MARKTKDSQVSARQQQILQTRARQLAVKPRIESEARKIEIVVFSLGEERFGIEGLHIEEVFALQDITAVPCTPDFVIGITNVRGNVYSVLDLRSFLDAPTGPITQDSMLIATSREELDVCLLVDRVEGKRDVLATQIKSIGANLKNIKKELLAGYFIDDKEIITLIDWKSVIKEANLVINEEA